MTEPVDLLIEHASQLVRVTGTGAARRGPDQGRLDDVTDGAVAVRNGTIVAAGPTRQVRSRVSVDAGTRVIGATDVIANLLPGAEMVYRVAKRANARLLIEQQVPVGIATDYCSSIHVSSLQACVGLATAWFGVTPAEAVVGATINGAYSLGRERSVGSLDPGKQADILMNVPHVNVMAWGFGTNYVETVIKRGRVVDHSA